MALENLMNLSHDVETGFIAGKTYRILQNSKRKITDDERATLEDGLDFIEKVKKGRELVNSVRLQSDAVSAIDIYTKTLITVSFMDKEKINIFESFILTAKKEIEDILINGRISKTKTKTSRQLFKYIREYTVNELSRKFYNENGAR